MQFKKKLVTVYTASKPYDILYMTIMMRQTWS